MNHKKILVLLLTVTIYINYINYIKKDSNKLQSQISNIENRTLKEEKLFKQKDSFKDINSTKEYSFLFYDGAKFSYSQAMGEFQKNMESSIKGNGTIENIQWQDMPMNKDKWYDTLSLRISFNCTAEEFIRFQNNNRKISKLFHFTQLRIVKMKRKNFLKINTTVIAYRIKKNEK